MLQHVDGSLSGKILMINTVQLPAAVAIIVVDLENVTDRRRRRWAIRSTTRETTARRLREPVLRTLKSRASVEAMARPMISDLKRLTGPVE
jgi:hypothetical protein